MSRNSRKVVVKQSTGQRIIEQSRIRLLCVGLFFMLCFTSISYRMIEVAVINNPKAVTITVSDADGEENGGAVSLKTDEVTLERGNIVDRNGVLLATSLITASLYANPKEIKNHEEVAVKLAKTLGIESTQILTRLKGKKSFVWIKRNLAPREQHAINMLGIPGLYFQPEERRVYPYGDITSHVVGYVGVDNKGLAGIEKTMDTRLRDTAENYTPLSLSLDVRLQAIMSEEVERAMENFQAIGGIGVIMDITSGELLSMVSLPDFDPHHPAREADKAQFNRVSLGVYEMGSTFKTFTMAMGLEHKIVNMTSGYDATNPMKISSFTIQDTHPQRRWLSVPEIYAYSSNIGTAKLALDVGARRQKAFLKSLGMLEQVDIELPERSKPLWPSDWKDISTVTISYGHGMSVTPLHLVRGIATIVGDGHAPRLTLLKDGNKNKEKGERVVSDQTLRNMRRLMRLVVDHGTGSKADVAGYRVGGKTGTAEKISSGGGYNEDSKIASFVATFPVDNPKYVVLVMIDEPKGNKSTYGYATGGWISAPVVGNVISRMGPILGIEPRYDVPEDDAEKFWVYHGKEKQKAAKPIVAQKKYYHAASY
ncbi:MAG: peptidoglycan D,D-transpeptidase FtsI family protein [Alphaproteobacteria bacterium]